MRFLVLSDIYGETDIIKELVSKVKEKTDEKIVTIIAGDLGLYTGSGEKEYNINVNEILSSLSEISKHIFYVPGEYDIKKPLFNNPNVINIDKQHHVLEDNDVKIGFIGLGGAPKHSVRKDEQATYTWDERIEIVYEDLSKNLKITYEKVMLSKPDITILVTHSPPYGIADHSKPITLKEMLVLEELSDEIKEREETERKEVGKTPRHLGSRVISKFLGKYPVDIHIFGHIHKQGGRCPSINKTKFVNVSHLSPSPYKLTGRKFLLVDITKTNIDFSFDSVVDKHLPFETFVETYL